jgi:hypothetical protein
VQRSWRLTRLVLGGYVAAGTLLMCLAALIAPWLFSVHGWLGFVVIVSVVVPDFVLGRYRMARGRELTLATSKTEPKALTSPDIYYYDGTGGTDDVGPFAQARVLASVASNLQRLTVVAQALLLMFAGWLIASALATAATNRAATAVATATVTSCSPYRYGTVCTESWTVAGQSYSHEAWASSPGADVGPQPAVGSTRTVTYDPGHPSVLGNQSGAGPGSIAWVVLTALGAVGVGAFGNYRYKPYRARVNAIAGQGNSL